MGLQSGCFDLINPPCTCHPIGFYHVGKGGGLLPGWCKILLRIVSCWGGEGGAFFLPAFLPTVLHQLVIY